MDVKPNKIPHPFKKLSKERIASIVKDIEEGSTHQYAAESNGITKNIFNTWLRQGRCDIEYDKDDSLPAQLVYSLAKVKQKEVKKLRKAIMVSEKGHLGAQWTLDRAYWKHFGSSAADKDFNERLSTVENGDQVDG